MSFGPDQTPQFILKPFTGDHMLSEGKTDFIQNNYFICHQIKILTGL